MVFCAAMVAANGFTAPKVAPAGALIEKETPARFDAGYVSWKLTITVVVPSGWGCATVAVSSGCENSESENKSDTASIFSIVFSVVTASLG